MIKTGDLNFFQKHYLTFFKNKNMRGKAEVYHAIIRFVLEKHYSPSIRDMMELFPDHPKVLLGDLKYLEKKGFLNRQKWGEDMLFNPVLRPFAPTKDMAKEACDLYSMSKIDLRAKARRDELNKKLNGYSDYHLRDWKTTFEEAGYSDYQGDVSPQEIDGLGEDLPPDFDDSEDIGGLVVVRK